MSRDIDYQDPESWTEADKVYLSQRMDKVPEEHRGLLTPAGSPRLVTPDVNPQMVKLTQFVRDNYPDRGEEDPVDVVISELGGDPTSADADDYDKWTVGELKTEAETREGLVAPTGDIKKKAPWIAALREWDAQHPVV